MASLFLSKRATLLVVGVLFHLLYLWSIFDIYFVSPLVHGMKQHRSTTNPPAKRLFLMVGDGQKAEATFAKLHHPVTGKDEFLAPYLRSVILNEGTYGLSHTRMPTESRPGHVAMIAGFYEDVSAVTKGWKENPVDFDSFFNQSVHTYSFGSPDILPMFAKGASSIDKVDTWMYGAESEDFTQSSIEVDRFVFDHLDNLFANSTKDSSLDDQIHQDGNVFFLHLLGTDTSGHSYKPYSAEYYDNIMYTDGEIKKLVKKVNDFFDDEDSAFIFTADHGMSDFGSHGDGHPNNTRTPFICWGAGCRKPVLINPRDNEFLRDPYESQQMSLWQLDDVKRHDIKQADITSLMSYLIGVNYPANSVGELPVDYIDAQETDKIRGLYLNSLSILEQYCVKRDEVASRQLDFRPFHKFEEKSIKEYKKEIENLLAKVGEAPEYEQQAVKAIEEFIKVILDGLDYLQKYNWLVMRTIVTLGFVGWIIYSYTMFLEMFVLEETAAERLVHPLSVVIYSVIAGAFAYQRAPLNNYFYAAFPVFFWDQIIVKLGDLLKGTAIFFEGMSVGSILLTFSFILIFFEAIAYGFTNRTIFSGIFLLLAIYPIVLRRKNSQLGFGKLATWGLLCLALSYFPSQNPIKTEDLSLIVGSGILLIIVGICGFIDAPSMTTYTRNVIFAQLLLIASSIYSTSWAVISLQRKEGLPVQAQYLNWFNLVVSLAAYYLHHLKPNRNYKIRYLIIYLTFAPTFLILTISFEGLFYVLFALMLYQWIDIESGLRDPKSKWLQLLRVSVIGFFNLQIAFFGTGNVSSVSSFSLESVCRLLPIFDPFPMGALLMLKLVIPYGLLSVALGLMNVKLHLKIFSISSLLISFSVILSLHFFYMVRTEGSWLDIGLTISNYCLAILSSLFMLILEVLSHVLLSDVEIEEEDGSIASRVRRRAAKKNLED
ncbi:DEKNAAC105020 [Brettanomyces naardenensis]|uniref:GPI ethanolamine phosphate transferase 1 n=1 Tax=Brettanomyces naardenensis TaxID=13370 RepID=A0A448YSA4_BRENA|nr:DEKNAAC105020 [Brettanomyces naardenensis]